MAKISIDDRDSRPPILEVPKGINYDPNKEVLRRADVNKVTYWESQGWIKATTKEGKSIPVVNNVVWMKTTKANVAEKRKRLEKANRETDAALEGKNRARIREVSSLVKEVPSHLVIR